MQNKKKSSSSTTSNSSASPGRYQSHPLEQFGMPARNFEDPTPTDLVDDTKSLERASAPIAPGCAISSTALSCVTASALILSNPQITSPVPAANSPAQEVLTSNVQHEGVEITGRLHHVCQDQRDKALLSPLLLKRGVSSSSELKASESIGHGPPGTIELSPWLDGPDYKVLYQEISHQTFDGYECIEKDMIRPNYRLPNRSIRAVERDMARDIPELGPPTEHEFDKDDCAGFSKSELLSVSQSPEGLTLGEAIQKIYMSRLYQSNRLLPMTKVYEGGWTIPVSREHRSIKAGTVWLGDVVDSVNFELLRAHNITTMVSVHPHDFRSRGQAQHGRNGEVVSSSPIRWHLQVRLADSREADMESEFDMIFDFIRSHVLEGHNVLVHCIAGLSRSVAVIRDFIQRIEVQRGKIDMTGTAAERYARMKESREATFTTLKVIRPGITEDNFRDQLDNSTIKTCGLPRQSRVKADGRGRPKSKEHGGGGYIGDSVAMVFFFYRLRPTPKVIKLFEQRRADHARMESVLGKKRNAFSFPLPLIEWFEECIHFNQDPSNA